MYRPKMSKKMLQRLDFNGFQIISTILSFKKAGFMAFRHEEFPKTSTLGMDDFGRLSLMCAATK